jgi:lantibiotic leader peptide-processing serine protease
MTRRLNFLSVAAVLAIAACSDQNTAPNSPAEAAPVALAKQSRTYVISLAANSPANVSNQIQQAGGRLKRVSKVAGVVTVESDAADFATKVKAIPGVEGVGLDRVIQWVDPNMRVVEAGHGADETFYNIQWGPQAIHAPQAWHTGALGAGARVAVLDGGLNNLHQDLNGSVDVACSASMVAGFNFNQDVGTAGSFSHATHVAGIVAARDNAVGTIGVAPSATIMGVKVLHGGSGSFEDVIEGILYAADPNNMGGDSQNQGNCKRADVINMSLGATFVPAPEDRELLRALDKATTFAFKQGVTIIASAGNDATDHDDGSGVVTVPAQSAHVISVAATGPVGFAVGYPNGATNFNRPASYTNFGRSLVDFSAPGGDFVYPGNENCTLPRNPTGSLTRPCWVFDLVFSPGTLGATNGYFWAAGTSMAAPHVAGVAALIIGKNRRMSPDQVEATLRRSADKLNPRAFHGNGFVNALRAVGGGQGGNNTGR